jgi:hypothetical protein
MSARNSAVKQYKGQATIADPGSSGVISIDKSPVQVNLVTAGAETRTLARPKRAGAKVTLWARTISTSCTVTVTGGLNEFGDTTIAFANAGEFAVFEGFETATAGTYEWRMIASHITGNLSGLLATVTELNRVADSSTRVVTTTVALGVTQALHDGKTIVLNNVVGFASTLPAMTGSGARYRFVVGATVTTPSHTIVATGAHLVGLVFMVNDTAATTVFTANSISANATPITTITLNGTTTGGRVGDWIEVEDVATNIGVVRGMVSASGTEATPFS